MRTIGIRVAAVILCLVLSCWGYAGQIVVDAPQDVGMSAEKLGRVSTAVQGLVDEEKIAGASVLVARKGKVAFFETFGMMDKEAGKPVDEDTIFRFYSMTKPVTSVAVMMLVEQGKIRLDDPVSKYIEPFKGLKVYDESGAHAEPAREMTVRDLLRHTSGLTYGFFGNTAVDKTYRENGILDRETSLDDMVEKLGAIPLLYQPGTRWHYGVSTDVLGYLVEKVSGESLDVFFERRIFAPLRMEDTAFYVPQDRADRFAVCYGPRLGKGLRVSDNPRKSEFLEKPGLLSGGGGLVSTAGDYLRFCSMLLNKGELDGKRLLRAETVEMMTRNQLPESVSWNGQGFGLGFSVQVTEGKYGAGEYGWGGAASTHFWIHPKQELIVIALSQLMPYSNQLADAVKPLVYEAVVEDSTPGVDLWTAAATGNIEAIKQHLEAGTDVDAKEPPGGSTPLLVAATFGQAETVKLLIEEGANVNATSNDGATPLHGAAFFCHTEIVKLLLDEGAQVNAKNIKGETPLDAVAGQWSQELEGIYKWLAELWKLQLDLERIKATRPKVAALLRKTEAKTTGQRKQAATEVKSTGYRGSYFMNGEIHVNTYGTPEGKPLTSGHQDFKPSWSKTSDMLVFFRRLKDDPVVTNWKTAICIINVDGSGFHQLTDGMHTDFNQTWTRDGTNTPIWNRKNPETGSFYVMKSKVGAEPGQEVALTDKSFHTWAYTCLKDGRILVQSAHPKQGWGYYLMTPNPDGEPRFERIECELATRGLLDRLSVSPSETRVSFEYQKGFMYKDGGRTLYIADFDAQKPAITKAKPFANEEGANRWFAYPRWTKDETAIVYHASPSLYLYTLKDGSTRKVSTNDSADYRYPHCEATPK